MGARPELHSKYSRTMMLVGISIDTNLDVVDAVIKQRRMTWPILADERGFDAPIPMAYHVQGTPDIFILDADGRIVNARAQPRRSSRR